MRIQLYSDLHLEFASFAPVNVEADVVVLAGDIHIGTQGIEWAIASIPQPVVYVLGNHEFYKHKHPTLVDKCKAAARGTHVTVLDDECVSIDGVCFFGGTLWTDFALFGDDDTQRAIEAARASMADFRRIRVPPTYRRFTPEDARRACRRSQAKLRAALDSETPPAVVVTHHLPLRALVDTKYADDPLSPAFASHLPSLAHHEAVDLWLYGHSHQAVDVVDNGTRFVCNPRGYPGEDTGFVIDKCVALSS